MKAKRKRSFLIAVFSGILAGAGGAGCLATAFSLTIRHPIILLLIFSVFGTFYALCFPRHSLVPLCLTALGTGWLWQEPVSRNQSLTMIQQILSQLSLQYRLKFPPLPAFPQQSDADYSMAVLGIWLIYFVVRSLRLRRKSRSLLPAAAFPLAICLIAGVSPAAAPLGVLLWVLCLLMLTGSVRSENLYQGNRAILSGAIPVLLGLLLLFRLLPFNSYVNHQNLLRDSLLDMLSALPQKMLVHELRLPALFADHREVNLAALGAQQQLGIPALTVRSQQGGTIYLRERDYDVYTGKSWITTENRRETFGSCGPTTNVITIRTDSPRKFLLLPYYPAQSFTLEDGGLTNRRNLCEYTLSCRSGTVSPFPDSRLLELPPETARRAVRLLQDKLGDFSSTTAAAQRIRTYVSGSAAYDLQPASMPEDEADFAMWFLESADRGYCTHFASAAAVLLRSIGIPARLVTGYMMEAIPGEDTVITSNHAHAWVEYYDYSTGLWHILEATPAVCVPESAAAIETARTHRSKADVPSAVLAGIPWKIPLLSFLILMPAAIVLQRILRLLLRHRRQHTGSPGSQAVARWAEAALHAALLREMPPEHLRALAEKAVFSQHSLTAEDLQSFTRYRRSCCLAFRRRPLYRRFIDRYYYCAY